MATLLDDEPDQKGRVYDDEATWKPHIPSDPESAPEEDAEEPDAEPVEETAGGASKKTEMSPEELEDAEEDAEEPATEGEASESKSLADKVTGKGEDDGGFFRKGDKKGFLLNGANFGAAGKKKSRKKFLIFGAAGGVLGFFAIIIAVLILFGSLKAVHFATVLRSAGFARFNLYMRRQFSTAIFDAAVLTDSSTGRFDIGRASMFERLRGINPARQLQQLGSEGSLRFQFDGNSSFGGLRTTNTFRGVEIDGRPILLDDISRATWDGRVYNDLSTREKLTVRNQFVEQVKSGMAERLALEGRSFRSGTYNGLRQATGIRMTKWASKARAFAGRSPPEARALNVEESIRQAEANRTGSSIGVIDDSAQEVLDAEKAKALGDPTPPTPGQARAAFARIAGPAQEVSTAVFFTTVACIIHDLDSSFDSISEERENRVAQYGHSTLTAADQIKYGDVTAEAVGAENAMWDGAENSIFYKELTGGNVSQADQEQIVQTPDVRPPSLLLVDALGYTNDILEASVGGPFVAALAELPFIGGLISGGRDKVIDVGCATILNQYVQYGLAGIDIGITVVGAFFTGGASAGGQFALRAAVIAATKAGARAAATGAAFIGGGHIIGSLIDNAAAQFSGTDFSGLETSTDRFNTGMVSTDYLQQTGTRQISYGRPMTDEETAASQTVAMQEMRNEYNSGSFTERYFAADNPFSLTGKLAAMTPSNLTTSASNTASFVRTVPSNVASFFTNPFEGLSLLSPFNSRVHAAQETSMKDYEYFGVDEWGWTNEENDRLNSEEQFATENVINFVEERYTELNNRYEKCYTYIKQSDKPDDCTREHLMTDDAMKWRKYMGLGKAADMLSEETLDPTTTTSPSGSSAGPGTDTVVPEGSLGVSPDGFVFPLRTTRSAITSGVSGDAWCFNNQSNCHHDYNAADIFAETGTMIVAAKPGTVTRTSYSTDFGQNVQIRGDDGFNYYYTHMPQGAHEEFGIRTGVHVNAGDPLGRVGTNANANTSTRHLHFDITSGSSRPSCSAAACPDSRFINPQPLLIEAFNRLSG